MKILFLADNFAPERNAQAARVYERACYWVSWGHRVTVLTCCPNFPEGKAYTGYENKWRTVEEVDGIRVVRVKTYLAPNTGRLLRTIDFLSFMVTAFFVGLFETKPDIIGATTPQFFAAIAGVALAKAKRAPFLLEVSDLWPESIVAVGAMKRSFLVCWLEKVELWAYRRAARIITLTEAFRSNLIQRGVPESKIDVILNGVDLWRYAPRPRDCELARSWGLEPDDFVVGYIGTHGMAHGLENVLEAAGRVTNPRIRFLFVGAGAARSQLIEMARARGLKNVLFEPAQPKEMTPQAWSVCDVALVHLRDAPLFETVIPSKIFEAMGMGLPILLVARSGEASDLIRRERVGLFVPAADPSGLVAAVEMLAANPAMVGEYAARSLAAAPGHSREAQARASLLALAKAVGPFSGPAPGDAPQVAREASGGQRTTGVCE